MQDPDYGQLQIMRWSNFHFKQSSSRAMEIIRVEVVTPVGHKRKFQPLWLAWLGQTMLELKTLWRTYLRRLTIKYWCHLAKQRWHWTQPQLSSIQATERWSFLVVLATWQLWLARIDCLDHPSPW